MINVKQIVAEMRTNKHTVLSGNASDKESWKRKRNQSGTVPRKKQQDRDWNSNIRSYLLDNLRIFV